MGRDTQLLIRQLVELRQARESGVVTVYGPAVKLEIRLHYGEIVEVRRVLTNRETKDRSAFWFRQLLTWKRLRTEFRRESSSGVFGARPELRLERLVVESSARLLDPASCEQHLADQGSCYPALTRPDVIEQLGLCQVEQEFLRRLDGARNLHQVRAGGELDTVRIGQIICALLMTDRLELRDRPLYDAPLSSGVHQTRGFTEADTRRDKIA